MRVYIPKNLQSKIKVKNESVQFGKDGSPIITNKQSEYIYAHVSPLSMNELQKFPQGMVNFGDIDIKTTSQIDEGITIVYNRMEYKIMFYANYPGVNFYIGKRIGGVCD